ncbi:hypothetical protein L665_00795 [Ralstonia solanacearum SD54]|nr:hypothetical protein A3768_4021 [Ralstonia solanacearum]ESS50607.1 hypothetical protein L665_00795 [Ralstonia solanacearum SD54]
MRMRSTRIGISAACIADDAPLFCGPARPHARAIRAAFHGITYPKDAAIRGLR